MNYQFDSIVTKKEAEALKDMIFKRVRERSQAMTDDVQADVMNLARESFVKSANNPFATMLNTDETEKSSKPAEETKKISDTTQDKKAEDIGFPARKPLQRISSQNQSIQEQISAAQIQNTMIEARSGLNKRTSFMGALNFLNSQAAVSLMRTRSDKFEAVV